MQLAAHGTQLGVDFDLAVELLFLGQLGFQPGRRNLFGLQLRQPVQLVAQSLASPGGHRQVLAQQLKKKRQSST